MDLHKVCRREIYDGINTNRKWVELLSWKFEYLKFENFLIKP